MGRTTDVLLGSPCRCGSRRLLLIDEDRDEVVFVCVGCSNTAYHPDTRTPGSVAESTYGLGAHRVATEEDLRERGDSGWIVGRTSVPHGRPIPDVGDQLGCDGCEDAPWLMPHLMGPWLRGAAASLDHRSVVRWAEDCVRSVCVSRGSPAWVYRLLAPSFAALGQLDRAASLGERAAIYRDMGRDARGWQDEPRSHAEAARDVEQCERLLPLWLEPADQLALLGSLESAERDRHLWSEWDLQGRTHARLGVPRPCDPATLLEPVPGVYRERLAIVGAHDGRVAPYARDEQLVFLDRVSGTPLLTFGDESCCLVTSALETADWEMDWAWDRAPRGWVVPTEAQLRELGLTDRVALVEVASPAPWHTFPLALMWLIGQAADARPRPAIDYESLLLLHAWHGRPRALGYEAFAKLHRVVGNDARAEQCLVRAAFHHEVDAAWEAKPFDANGLRRIEDRAETLLPEWPDEFDQVDLRRVIAWCRADRVRARLDALREEWLGPTDA